MLSILYIHVCMYKHSSYWYIFLFQNLNEIIVNDLRSLLLIIEVPIIVIHNSDVGKTIKVIMSDGRVNISVCNSEGEQFETLTMPSFDGNQQGNLSEMKYYAA